MIVNTFKKNIIILTTSNILIGIMGSLFSIYCTRLFGAEGTALINIVTSIYTVFLVLLNGGMNTSISKIVAEQIYFNNKSKILSTIKISVYFILSWSVLIVSLFLIFIFVFKNNFNSDINVFKSLLITCPCIVFMSVGNIFKGYFIGVNHVKTPAFIDAVEKLSRFLILGAIVYLSMKKYHTYTIVCVYACYCTCEFISMLMLFIHYKKDTKTFERKKATRTDVNFTLKYIIKYALPLCIVGLIAELADAVSPFIVINRLSSIGFDYNSALSLMGKFKGMAFLVASAPIMITSSMCVLLIPKIASLISKSNFSHAKVVINKAIYISVVVGLSTAIVCVLFSEQIGLFLFKRTDLGLMIRLSGLVTPIIFTASTLNSVLIGLNKQKIVFRNSLVHEILLLTGLFLFIGIPKLNIFGYILAILISNSVFLFLNYREIKKTEIQNKEIMFVVNRPFKSIRARPAATASMNKN